MNRYYPVRGAYVDTTDDRMDRWYIEDRESTVVDRRGPGWATRRECEEEIDRRGLNGPAPLGRYRFKVPAEDYRPVLWPLPMGRVYWCTGSDSNDSSILVAYMADEDELLRHWPDAEDIDEMRRGAPEFTDRFPRPDWYEPQAEVSQPG
jgi:hypothetical protein